MSYQRWTGRVYNPITVGDSLVFSSPWKQTGGVGGPPPRLNPPVGETQGHPMGIRSQLFRLLRIFPEFFPRFFKPPQKLGVAARKQGP